MAEFGIIDDLMKFLFCLYIFIFPFVDFQRARTELPYLLHYLEGVLLV